MILHKTCLSLLIIDLAFLSIVTFIKFYRVKKIYIVISTFGIGIVAFAEMVHCFLYLGGQVALDAPELLPPWAHFVWPLLAALHCITGFIRESKLHYKSITRASILNAVNEIDSGLMFVYPNGSIALINRRMEKLAMAMTGKYPFDGKRFWKSVITLRENDNCKRIDFTKWPAFLFTDGDVWAFDRHLLMDGDRTYYEIEAKNVTSLYEKQNMLEKETKKLAQMELELAGVFKIISETRNEEELLNYKIRIHDQLGNAVLRTRKELRDSNLNIKDVEEILHVWENTVKAFEQNIQETGSGTDGNLDEVFDQAKTLGIELQISGKFPAFSPLCVRAVRESMYNSIRHAYANLIKVDSYRAGDGYHFRISDDGQVKIEKVTEGGGLTSLRNAFEKIGGSMTVSVWDGVEINFFFPYTSEKGVKGAESSDRG